MHDLVTSLTSDLQVENNDLCSIGFFAKEKCLRVSKSPREGPLYLSQKEEEIRDGVLHLKPKFHQRTDVLFVEFPTPETAKQVATGNLLASCL